MIDQRALDTASQLALDRGLRVLQGHRLATTDREHIARLLDYMAPEAGSHWLDIGSGFGEPAGLMLMLRPDLRFTLLNNNKFQIDRTPKELYVLPGDMHTMPFSSGYFDGAMFLYSFCHADSPWQALSEAARVVRSDGVLFVYDYVRVGGDNDVTEKLLFSRFWYREELLGLATFAGWREVLFELPSGGDDTIWRDAIDDPGLYEDIFSELEPMVWKLVRA